MKPVKTFLFYGLIGILITGFQNCSQANLKSSPTGNIAEQPTQTSPDENSSNPEIYKIDLSVCHDRLDGQSLSEVQSNSISYDVKFDGTLCAIKPSETALPGKPIKDNILGPFGFGYHAIGIPKNLNANTPVLFHFGGTYGRPYNQSVTDSNGEIHGGEFVSQIFLGEAINKGYLVIQLAYANQASISGDYCKPDQVNPTQNNCSSSVRENILFGTLSTIVDTGDNDTWNYRLERLLSYLKEQNFPLPNSLKPGNLNFQTWEGFESISLSGHSQGAGHAHFLGKYHKLKSICLIAGGYDRNDQQQPINAFADWINDPTPYQTPLENFNAMVVEEDDFYDSFVGTYENILGLVNGISYFTAENLVYHNKDSESIVNRQNPSITDAHGAAIGAVELKQIRERACF